MRASVIPSLRTSCITYVTMDLKIEPAPLRKVIPQSYSVKIISSDYVCARSVLILYLSAGSTMLQIQIACLCVNVYHKTSFDVTA